MKHLEALRHGTCSQGIPQFYLRTHTFICNRNELYLPLPSQPQLVLIYRPRRDGRLSYHGWLGIMNAAASTSFTFVAVKESRKLAVYMRCGCRKKILVLFFRVRSVHRRIQLTLRGAESCSCCRLRESRRASSAFICQQPMNVCSEMTDRYTDDARSAAASASAGTPPYPNSPAPDNVKCSSHGQSTRQDLRSSGNFNCNFFCSSFLSLRVKNNE